MASVDSNGTDTTESNYQHLPRRTELRHLHFSNKQGALGGYYHIPADPPGPIGDAPCNGGVFGSIVLRRLTATAESNLELIKIWENLEKERDDWSYKSWNIVHNCWIPVLQFQQEGTTSQVVQSKPGSFDIFDPFYGP